MSLEISPPLKFIFTIAIFICASTLWSQERPQETRPAPSPERAIEIRDSIRNLARVKFKDKNEEDQFDTRYVGDQTLFMPKMERASIFRLGIPFWLIRGLVWSQRTDFDTDHEYQKTRNVLKNFKRMRMSIFVRNPVYKPREIIAQYEKYMARKKTEAMLKIKSPGGTVMVDIKVRRNKIKGINMLALGDEGGTIVRLKTKIELNELRGAIDLIEQGVEDSGNMEINLEPN